MSASRNTDALANQENGGSGQFSSRIQRDEPLTTSGHQPGKLVGNDAAPTFSAQTLPPGSAPASQTFTPQPSSDAPLAGGVGSTDASATLGGATSGDVHTGLGHPGQGQSSAEQRHDGHAHRKNAGGSLEGTGASGVGQGGVNAHDPQFAGQRALNKDVDTGMRSDIPGAEERLPQGAGRSGDGEYGA